MKVAELLNEMAALTSAEVRRAADAIDATRDAADNESHFAGIDGAEIYLPDVGFQKGGRIFGFPRRSDSAKHRVALIPLTGNNLHYAQTSVQKKHLKRGIEKWSKEDPDSFTKDQFGRTGLPDVVYHDGKFYVQDGHHRVTIYKLAGREYVKVNLVVALDADNKWGIEYERPKVDKAGRFVLKDQE